MTIGQNLNVTRLSLLMIISQSPELTSYITVGTGSWLHQFGGACKRCCTPAATATKKLHVHVYVLTEYLRYSFFHLS